jgi:hypothetical protein
MAVATSCVCALVIGFMTGFLLARRCSCSSRDEDNPYHVPYLNQLVFCLFFKIDQFNPPLMICPCTKTLENAPIKNMFS